MTKWQESCITALASSPLAWEAFKMKQRNKRMLWQYVNRIWPYKRIKKTRTSTLEYTECINELKIFTKWLVNNRNTIEEAIFRFKDKKVKSSILEEALKNITKPISTEGAGGNYFLEIVITYKSGDADRISTCGSEQIVHIIRNRWGIKAGNEYYINRIRFFSSLSRMNEMFSQLYTELQYIIRKLELLRDRSRNYNPYILYNSLNIGIEIEHDADNPTSEEIKKLILRHNCSSYDSGFDGNMDHRLRENRIRLNGINGLKGLYILLEDMKENTAIARNSSVHMHIDCKYDEYNEYYTKYYKKEIRTQGIYCWNDAVSYYTKRLVIRNPKAIKYLQYIFNYKNVGEKSFWSNSHSVRIATEFDTIEYRFLIVNLKYSDYVIQMLALIHITECIKHNCILNKSYLSTLATVAKSLRK
ncbi:hypothetical protein [uncultured phage cr114_1]|uniref:Uncharacterized protein n=1 Tax=uncultured phage cr114_1 TaxID=2772088 RepID=A0A7M1RZU4_9CAUD|nr:hypothetical protein KNV55_gp078 [uncultured phage cr114_1]QOR59947.1 hypothetical protein [uncultured phage cr114_1]